MSIAAPSVESRLLIVADVDRLGPVARDHFAPMPIAGVRSYLHGIAEIPRAPTQAVLIGVDPECRQVENAVAAMRDVAGDARIVLCCEPAYETWGPLAVSAGANEYVIYPPSGADLETALGIPARGTREQWSRMRGGEPSPSAAELAILADVIAALDSSPVAQLDRIAALVREGLAAAWVRIMVDDRVGHALRPDAATSRGQPADNPTLVEIIQRREGAAGQIMVGPRVAGAFGFDDTQKLRHYGVLIGNLLDAAGRTQHWRELAYHDDLTGLGNRRYLMRLLDNLLGRAARERSAVTVLLFDIDDFKRYNDQYGHAAGDDILRETAQLFVRCCRKDDVVCRLGGDEFVVAFWDAEPPRSAGSRHPSAVVAVLNRFKAALASHTFARLGPEAVGCLTISGGLATFPWQATTAADLLQRADEALLEAKSSGKNSFWLVGTGDVCRQP